MRREGETRRKGGNKGWMHDGDRDRDVLVDGKLQVVEGGKFLLKEKRSSRGGGSRSNTTHKSLAQGKQVSSESRRSHGDCDFMVTHEIMPITERDQDESTSCTAHV